MELGKEKGLIDYFGVKLKEGQTRFQGSMELVSQNRVETGIDVETGSLKSKCMDDRSSLVKPQAYVSGKSRVDNLVGKDMVTSEVQHKVELVYGQGKDKESYLGENMKCDYIVELPEEEESECRKQADIERKRKRVLSELPRNVNGVKDSFEVGMAVRNKDKLRKMQKVGKGLREKTKKVSLKGLVEVPIKVDMEIGHSGEFKEEGCLSDGYGSWPLIATEEI
ncbi:hypothetical protein J1N35_008454 [Gossypium stocksii]|uniref:Uncharacterized protein n=1 Tax=Gossypium stocksii TaxID=47602 RepID=A0A9D3W942_9ROSI|nr:hypothetical protein J1N35_008454 [Gossypium stocksii]